MHANEGTDDFKMAEFFGANVEEQVTAGEVVHAVPALDGVLHGRGEFTVRSAELFEEKIAKFNVGGTDVDGILQFLMW